MDYEAYDRSEIRSMVLGTEYVIRIDRDLVDNTSWSKELDIIACAGESDIIKLKINSPGGSVYLAIEFITTIINSPALVVGELVGIADSAASMILLACDDYIINPFTRMLIHAASYGVVDNMPAIKSEVDFTHKELESMFYKIYGDFLLDEEIEIILNGKPLFINSEDIITRLEYRKEMFDIEKSEEIDSNIDPEVRVCKQCGSGDVVFCSYGNEYKPFTHCNNCYEDVEEVY